MVTQERLERALQATGAPVRLRRSNGTVDTFGRLARTTAELFDGDRQTVTMLTVPASKAEGLKQGDRVDADGRTWTVAVVASNTHTATVTFRESVGAGRG